VAGADVLHGEDLVEFGAIAASGFREEKLLAGEVGWFHGATFRERMVRLCQEENSLGVEGQRLVREICRTITHVDDEIELAGFEFDGEGVFDVRAEADFDKGEFAAEVAKDNGQAIGKDAFGSGDAQGAARLVTDCFLALFHGGKGLLGEGLETAAGIGERDAAAEAVEEWNAEFFLECLDLRGHVGLHGVNALGGAGEVEFFGESPKYLKLAYFHGYLQNRWKSSYQSIGQIV